MYMGRPVPGDASASGTGLVLGGVPQSGWGGARGTKVGSLRPPIPEPPVTLPTTSPSRALAALLAAGALALGACAGEASDTLTGGSRPGSGDAGPAPGVPEDVEATFDEAIENTRAVTSAAVTLDIEVDSPIGGGALELVGDLSRDDVGTLTASSGGDLGDTFSIELRSDGETVYLTSDAPDIEDALPSGAEWVEASIDDLREADAWTGLDTTFDVLSLLRGVDEVSDGGTTDIGGDEVRLLEGDVDWDAALDASDPDERDGLESTISLGADTVIDDFTVIVGLDGDNRIRLFEIEVLAGAGDDVGFDMGELTMRLGLEAESFDHDVAVPDAPPADETVPIGDVPEIEDALREGL